MKASVKKQIRAVLEVLVTQVSVLDTLLETEQDFLDSNLEEMTEERVENLTAEIDLLEEARQLCESAGDTLTDLLGE